MKTAAVFFMAFVIAFAIPFSAFSQMFIWIDKDGAKHFTNITPPPEVETARELDESSLVENPGKPPETIIPATRNSN